MSDYLMHYKTAAVAAAAWWAHQIHNPVFRAVGPLDSPEDHAHMEAAAELAHLAADQNPVSPEASEAFTKTLAIAIAVSLNGTGYMGLWVDYAPDSILATAAAAAGISETRFPWKTYMRVTREAVAVSLGYGAPQEIVWQRSET